MTVTWVLPEPFSVSKTNNDLERGRNGIRVKNVLQVYVLLVLIDLGPIFMG